MEESLSSDAKGPTLTEGTPWGFKPKIIVAPLTRLSDVAAF
jgi:hypothetical protein